MTRLAAPARSSEGRRRSQARKVTLYGQEKDDATAGLARMNMILHNNADGAHRTGEHARFPSV